MNARSIAVVMITVDRSPRENYLARALDNLKRGGVFVSGLLNYFHVINSTPSREHFPLPLWGFECGMSFWFTDRDLLACENAGRALKIGAESGAPWVLFCEDDIDTCSRFLESVSTWLDQFANDRYGIYPFASPYDVNNSNSQQTAECAWDSFYGTQCFAIRPHHANLLGNYLLSNPLVKGKVQPTFYDLMIADWLHTNNLLILCSNPSFVEHIGRESRYVPITRSRTDRRRGRVGIGHMISRSQRVRAADFDTEWFIARARELGQEVGRYHRKIWEYAVIAQVFNDHVLDPAVARWQHSSAKPNLKALGFGCGKEPIPKWLSQSMVNVVATDAPDNNPAWTDTEQRSRNLADLGLDSDDRFVSFREVDMNSIPDDLLQGQFDFTWSCGSFEHIGGIDQSLEFFRNQMLCLKPGGIACHTTELNIDLDALTTLESANLVLFRLWDLGVLAGTLWKQGDKLWYPDLRLADTAIDRFVDRPPYAAPYHLNIEVGGHVTTSVVLIATRGSGNVNGDNRS